MRVKYPTYNLTFSNGIKRKVKVHRMVAESFIPNPENKPCVNHKDGDTHNFKIDNLEWVTESENSRHALQTGLKSVGDQTPNYIPILTASTPISIIACAPDLVATLPAIT